jgi:hypothetical protein
MEALVPLKLGLTFTGLNGAAFMPHFGAQFLFLNK